MDWLHQGARIGLHALIRRSVRRAFHSVLVAGAEETSQQPGPLLLCPNHSNWWDGFLCLHLMALLPERRIALMQEQQHLDRYAFFRYAGVFGIDLETTRSAVGGLRTALDLLDRPETALWMFPQGELLPARAPIVAQPGVSYLAAKREISPVPVGIRYDWTAESRPTVLVRFGSPLEGEPRPEKLSAAIENLLAGIDEDLAAADLQAYQPIDPPRVSINERWDRWNGR